MHETIDDEYGEGHDSKNIKSFVTDFCRLVSYMEQRTTVMISLPKSLFHTY